MTNRSWLITLTLLALAGGLQAGEQTPARLPLDTLLETPISTAAKYDQQLSSVAASVSVITADEIERYGWTSLAEVLEAVRGFYETYDRNYAYIGVRGIGRPTDYNSRLLILIDGQPVTDAVFGGAAAGNDLAIDMAMVAKIEIVRGPGSALYGTHAMLAVINIFTKNADAIDTMSMSAVAGSHQKRGASMRTGKELANGLQLTASGYWQEINGANLFFPEYDAPETNHGVARNLDYEALHRFALTLRKGGLRLAISTRSRTKGVPTAMYNARFNADQATTDAQDLVTADYHRALDATKTIELRGYWDRGRYRGHFPYDELGTDRYVAQAVGGEARLQWDLSPNHRLTTGVEYVNAWRVDYGFVVGDYKIDLNRPYDMTSYYLQYEAHPSPKFGFVGGIRRDDFSATADSTAPRAAILITPNRSTTLKLLYGTAFRSPNVYEAFYADSVMPWKAHPDLKPETIRTTELVWERRLSPETMLVGSAFHINANHLIDQRIEPVEHIAWYDNVGTVESNGVELEAQMRRQDGLWARVSGSLQRTRSDGQPASNSPRYLLKGGLSNSPWAPFHVGVEGTFEAARRTRDGATTNPFLLVNATMSKLVGKSFRVALTAHNLFNTDYSNPVGPELRPQSIRQDGRTFTLRLTYSR
jgi:iron complex outermembrane receptor protein